MLSRFLKEPPGGIAIKGIDEEYEIEDVRGRMHPAMANNGLRLNYLGFLHSVNIIIEKSSL